METPLNLTKLYYTMGEVSTMFDVNQSLLRYWDKEFPSLRPKKNRKGDRRFTKEDIAELAVIFTLVKERGFTIEGARNELSTLKNNKDSNLVPQNPDLMTLLLKLKTLKSTILDFKSNISN